MSTPSKYHVDANASLDDTDAQIIDLMLGGLSNREISQKIHRPMSTIQRRTRKLLELGIMSATPQLNYQRLGLKRGLIHIYMKNGNAPEMAEKIRNMHGISAVSLHIGNSDVVAEYVCRNVNEVLQLTLHLKNIDMVEKVVWSEEVYRLESAKRKIGEMVREAGNSNYNAQDAAVRETWKD